MSSKKVLVLGGISWDDTWQRHHNIVVTLIEHGCSVDYVGGIKSSSISMKNIKRLFKRLLTFTKRKKIKNKRPVSGFREFYPLNIPFKSIFNVVSAYFLKKNLNDRYDLIIYYVPCHYTSLLIVPLRSDKLIYDCVRNFEFWPGIDKSVTVFENELLAITDKVVVDSYYLFDKLSAKHHSVFQILPTTKDVNIFPKEVSDISTLGFFGTISEHFDIDVLPILEACKINLLVWGVDELNLVERFGNVVYMGYISDERELIEEINNKCDGLLIPYVGFMDGVIPAKIIQSCITGLPVFISSFYDSRKLSELFYVYLDMKELHCMLEGFVTADHVSKCQKMINFSKQNLESNFKDKVYNIFLAR